MAGEYRSLKKQHCLNLIKECANSGKTSSNGVLKTESSIPRSCAGRLYPAYASGSYCICRCMRFNLNDFGF